MKVSAQRIIGIIGILMSICLGGTSTEAAKKRSA